MYDECEQFYIADCFECGACAYTCPANIPLVHYIKVAKKELAKRAANK
jgi:electron transport complex protein RnfC